MSGDETTIPTNEEVVDELTKELETQFTVCTEETSPSLNCAGKTPDDTSHQNTEFEDNSDDSGNEEGSSPDKSVPDDFIDEEVLKDLESHLSDEDRELKRNGALQLKNKGNAEFKSEQYLESIVSYTEGLRTCPLKFDNDRAVLYANRAASKIQLGRKECALDDCKKAIELNPNYVRAYIRRAKIYEELQKLDESLADFQKVLEFDAANTDALSACNRLPPLIEDRNEKMKTEMLGKLKDLGNMILRPFGLSTENFQLQKDPNSGGYSVNFQQNKPN